jgi:hypothetical protein
MPLALAGGRSIRMQIGTSKSHWATQSCLAARTAERPTGRLISTPAPWSARPETMSCTCGSGSERDVLDASFWQWLRDFSA